MACVHPQVSWVGTADGIHCGLCGALVKDIGAPKAEPKKIEPAPEPEAEPEPVEEKPVKKAPAKKGGKR